MKKIYYFLFGMINPTTTNNIANNIMLTGIPVSFIGIV